MNNTPFYCQQESNRITLKDYPPVLCVKQVAEILLISHNTAYELIRSRKIRSVRVGRGYRITLDAVIEYLNNN